MRVDIERIKALKAELVKFNALPLEDIQFFENGLPVEVDPAVLEEWSFTGLNNADFVIGDVYKSKGTMWTAIEST